MFCEGKIKTCELMALRTKKLCLSSIKLFCWGCDNTRPSWLSQMTPPPGPYKRRPGYHYGCQRLLPIDLIGTRDFHNILVLQAYGTYLRNPDQIISVLQGCSERIWQRESIYQSCRPQTSFTIISQRNVIFI